MFDTVSNKIHILEDEVHVWCSFLHPTVSQLDRMRNFLFSREAERAEQFYFQNDRECYIATHGILRELLGRYTGKHPAGLCFKQDAYGKPFLAFDDSCAGISFNLSHSYDAAVFAFTVKRQIGIDVDEYMRPVVANEGITEYFFSPREFAQLRKLNPKLQTRTFFNCWTRKEAFIKTKGEGMSIPLNQFDVSLLPGKPAFLLRTEWDANEAKKWSLLDLYIGNGYASALAVEGHNWTLKCLEYMKKASNGCLS